MLANTKAHLAASYIEIGREAHAAKLNLPSLVETLHSPEDQARAKITLAGLAVRHRDLKSAETIYLEVLSFWMGLPNLSSNQADVATALNNLGVIAFYQGRTTLARERLEQALRLRQEIDGPGSPYLMRTMVNLASACMRAKQYDIAATWLEKSVIIGRETLGDVHPFTVATTFVYAKALRKSGRKSEAKRAEQAAEQARGRMCRSPSDGYTMTFTS
jgi:Tfp pilus assembly protein PilF